MRTSTIWKAYHGAILLSRPTNEFKRRMRAIRQKTRFGNELKHRIARLDELEAENARLYSALDSIFGFALVAEWFTEHEDDIVNECRTALGLEQ